ncbi:MAG: glycosyltransferase family 4 protein [Actinomycetota bacterium]|nr:glycosyltransferase family 4 protein [Actinomycetota bacterium]
MLGWELPPHHSGGLGTACEGMTRGLARQGISVSFVLPKAFQDASYNWMDVYDASAYALRGIAHHIIDEQVCFEYITRHQCSLTSGYQTFAHGFHGLEVFCRACFQDMHTNELSHIGFYSRGVTAIAQKLHFEAIHAHDWMTFPAAVAARRVAMKRGKWAPFIAQIHATEIDRHDGPRIYAIEKWGMQEADRIIAVSNYTKSIIVKYYGINPDKISVVHNGIEPRQVRRYPRHPLKRRYKIVLFIGRITYQKGPDYYVRLAKKVTDQYPDVKFLMVGSGDMQAAMVEMAAREGLVEKLLFNQWVTGEMMDVAYQMADVFVMPSVSEPFGIVPLEAIQNGTPVVLSKNSGVSEVIQSCIAVDFWDIDKMAEAIIKLLKNEPYARLMVNKAQQEVNSLTWDLAASKLSAVYNDVVYGRIKEVA